MLNWSQCKCHDDVIKWKHFPSYWPFVRGIHRSPGNSVHKGQWCRVLMFSLISAWTNSWANNEDAGDLRCYCAHFDVIVMPQDLTDDTSTLIRVNMKRIRLVFWKIQSGHNSVHRRTDGWTRWNQYPPSTSLKGGYNYWPIFRPLMSGHQRCINGWGHHRLATFTWINAD